MSNALCHACTTPTGLPDLTEFGDTVTFTSTTGTVAVSEGGPFMALNSFVLTDRAPRRGTNVINPSLDGMIGRKRYRTERDVDLEVRVSGAVDLTGAMVEDSREQVETNIDHLADHTIDAEADEKGQIICTVVRKSGQTLSGYVRVMDFVAQHGIGDRIVVMQLNIPAGWLPPVV